MDKETSSHVSSIAAEILAKARDDDYVPGQDVDFLWGAAKTLAGSCLSQDETPGQEKPADDFFARLKAEREDLDNRLGKLAVFLGNGAPGITKRHKAMLDEQSRLMSDLLAVLDERIADIEISKRSTTENDHAE